MMEPIYRTTGWILLANNGDILCCSGGARYLRTNLLLGFISEPFLIRNRNEAYKIAKEWNSGMGLSNRRLFRVRPIRVTVDINPFKKEAKK